MHMLLQNIFKITGYNVSGNFDHLYTCLRGWKAITFEGGGEYQDSWWSVDVIYNPESNSIFEVVVCDYKANINERWFSSNREALVNCYLKEEATKLPDDAPPYHRVYEYEDIEKFMIKAVTGTNTSQDELISTINYGNEISIHLTSDEWKVVFNAADRDGEMVDEYISKLLSAMISGESYEI